MNYLRISPDDTVGVIREGEYAGHKLALRDIPKGEKVIKYGYPIGIATAEIKIGEIVHTQNLKTALGDIVEYTYQPGAPKIVVDHEDSFMGYPRQDGRVGIRNEIWVIPTVGCVSKITEEIARVANKSSENLCDGVFAFPHPYGCSQLGEDSLNTQKILAGLIRHPNAAGVLVIGLGCENNQIEALKKVLGDYAKDRVKFLECQKVDDEIAEGIKLVDSLMQSVGNQKRMRTPLSKLVVGLKCGGSDGFSGITANPLVGEFTDILINNGGTAVLSEVPEMFGAETILMNRCATKRVFDKTVEMINDFKQYYQSNNQPIYENPSPGNKEGGITTLEEKSLGCIQKSGLASIVDVLNYGEAVRESGLNLLSAPGNDLVASTALAAAGAQIVLFTTGRGTPFGCPVPTVKISTNSALYQKKSGWIDFDAGTLLNNRPMESLAKELYQYVKKVAAGETKTRNEINQYREIALFKTGVTL